MQDLTNYEGTKEAVARSEPKAAVEQLLHHGVLVYYNNMRIRYDGAAQSSYTQV